jgi:hypothetical protein
MKKVEMNKIEVSEDGFLRLPQEQRDRAILAALNEVNNRMAKIESRLNRRWKVNTSIMALANFAGAMVAHLVGGNFFSKG